MEQELEFLSNLMNKVTEFAVAYGFQIVGALVVFIIGLKVAAWFGKKIQNICENKGIDATLSRFSGNAIRLIVVICVVIITLGNFGITIAPLIALAGASAFGATFAIQGPLANYGAGLVIILTRPFVVGNTVSVRDVTGVVEEITLSSTILRGEDSELITIPNKQIVGEIIVNSDQHKIVETNMCIEVGADVEVAVRAIRDALNNHPALQGGRQPQVGVQDFAFGGIVVGLRYWVPSQKYFETRFAVNADALKAVKDAGISLAPYINFRGLNAGPVVGSQPDETL